MLMTPSSIDKSAIEADQLIVVDEDGCVVEGAGRSSAEVQLHVVIYQCTDARVVLHTHSVWNTLLSRRHVAAGVLRVSGLELLKALSGVSTHEHVESIPVYENTQNMTRLAAGVSDMLSSTTGSHAFLLAGHGLYTWGDSYESAWRHLEALEFLFEVLGREQVSGQQA